MKYLENNIFFLAQKQLGQCSKCACIHHEILLEYIITATETI